MSIPSPIQTIFEKTLDSRGEPLDPKGSAH
jgi:hypothetical protein